MKRILVALVLTSLLISSCSVLENSLNKRVVMTLTAWPTGTPGPTVTPYPTYTFYPADSPTPTLAPEAAFIRWNVDQVMQAFMSANLPVGTYRAMTREDYGAAPQMALQGICFFTSSATDVCDGFVLSYIDQTSLDKTHQFFVDQGGDSGWLFVSSNVLVRIRPAVAENEARNYEAALANLQ